ncbi:MAG: amidohydrolase [Proteobacteria bacterium]|nr:amidohydrolase [Pseudomonadota bacterium]
MLDQDDRLDLMLAGGRVLTLDREGTDLDPGRVGVRGGGIVLVEPDEGPRPKADRLIEAKGQIILPGLVNCHLHAPMTLFRGLADDLPLDDWLSEHIFPAEAKWVDPDMVYWCTLLAAAEGLLSGTTCMADSYFEERAAVRAFQESGLRVVCAQGVIDFPAPGVPDPARNIEVAERFCRETADRGGLITPAIFCHSIDTCSAETLRKARGLADRLGVGLMIHLAETKGEVERCRREHGRSPVAYLDGLGFLQKNVVAVHAVWVDEDDAALLARRGVGVAHCLESNLKLGSGLGPMTMLRAAGLTVGLGTDGPASNNDLDMFGEMRSVALGAKGAARDPTALPAGEVLRMATRDGARVLGLADWIGTIEIGRQADLIVLDADAAHLTPMYDPVSHLVYAADRSDVRHVIVDGRVVVEDRAIKTFDLARVMAEVRRLAARVKTAPDDHAASG